MKLFSCDLNVLLSFQATGLAAVLEKFLVKINDVKILILSTFDGVELMTGMSLLFFVAKKDLVRFNRHYFTFDSSARHGL